MITDDDRTNFIALLKSHEELVALVHSTSTEYFRSALESGPTPRAELIGNALDDLQLPLEANIKRIRSFLDAENSRTSSRPPENKG